MTKLVEVKSEEFVNSQDLGVELQRLFTASVSARHTSGMTIRLRNAFIRDTIDDGEEGFTELIKVNQQNCSPPCDCEQAGDCDLCNPELQEVCSIESMLTAQKERSPFATTADLLTTTKKYEYIALAENAYASIGNKPFKLKSTKDPSPSDDQIKQAASAFYQFLERFLETNEVRIDEIPEAFNLETLSQVTTTLADEAQRESDNLMQEAIANNEVVLERVFKRTKFMSKYLEVLKDTTDYPIGIMWIEDKALKKERKIVNGKMQWQQSIQADATRVDPCYFWATEDHTLNEPGRAVFKLDKVSRGDLLHWKDRGLLGSKVIEDNMDEYLDSHTNGFRMTEALLFRDHAMLDQDIYDVLVCRGTFMREQVEALGIDIPTLYDKDSYIPCEVHYSGGKVLKAKVITFADDNYGVFTTVFRRRGQSIFGYSLHEFIYPFAKLYAGAIDGVDISVGKATGSIIQVDTGVLEDPDKYLKEDADGNFELDLASDLIIEFDSTNAYASPNFKGIPLTVTQLPSDLAKLVPVVDFAAQQLERVSGIPSILVNSQNISSALRTNSNFNAAFSASAKVVQSLLREGENRILEPSIVTIFDIKASSGDMKQFLLDAEPEVLLSDTLSRERNDNQDLLLGLQTLAQYNGIIPTEKLGGLINAVGRRVWGLDEDLVPGVGALRSADPANEVASV